MSARRKLGTQPSRVGSWFASWFASRVRSRVPAGLAAVLVTMLAGLPGCSADDSEPPAARPFVETDSAGVQILVTPGAEAVAPLAWELDSVPDLVLGIDSAPSGPFMRVVNVVALPEGEVLVMDAGRRELIRFDAGGGELARRGHMGQGPGEFIEPRLVPTAGTDSIIVYDINQARVTVFSPDLEQVRIERLESDHHGRVVPIGEHEGQWLRQHRTFNGSIYVTAPMFAEGPVEEVRTLFLSDPKTGAERELTSDSVVRSFVSDKHGPRGPNGHIPMRTIPHAPTPVWALAPGALLVSDGRSYEIRHLDSRGQLARVLRIDATPEPMTPEMLEGWVRRERRLPPGSSVDPAHLAEYADHPIPGTLPSFRSLVVDAEGWLWAEVYRWDPREPGKWTVFDPEGRARGTMQTPVGFEVHAITSNRMLGVWRSPLGEEFVNGYDLLRAGAEGQGRGLGQRVPD